ncbi:hypothetical protein BN1088_1431635 [Sphingobacterium sp. PM2-P1-29]|nr:hypothetical protein BN1088_1431635 [Sphingobacterium sp. PM2-P1-29]
MLQHLNSLNKKYYVLGYITTFRRRNNKKEFSAVNRPTKR